MNSYWEKNAKKITTTVSTYDPYGPLQEKCNVIRKTGSRPIHNASICHHSLPECFLCVSKAYTAKKSCICQTSNNISNDDANSLTVTKGSLMESDTSCMTRRIASMHTTVSKLQAHFNFHGSQNFWECSFLQRRFSTCCRSAGRCRQFSTVCDDWWVSFLLATSRRISAAQYWVLLSFYEPVNWTVYRPT